MIFYLAGLFLYATIIGICVIICCACIYEKVSTWYETNKFFKELTEYRKEHGPLEEDYPL